MCACQTPKTFVRRFNRKGGFDMTLIKHELKQGQATLLIWTSVIGFMLAACILIYPEMGTQMSDVGSMFAEMGNFSAAFGMDRLNF